MRPITETLLFDDALALVMNEALPITRTESLPLVLADGRVASRDEIAAVDVPPFDRAAMDGYAVVAGDTFGAGTHAPRSLTCVGTLFTGQAPTRGIGPGECIEIATGAPMPPGRGFSAILGVGGAVLLCDHGIEHMPRKPLDSFPVRARLRRVESSMCPAVVAGYAVGGGRMRGPMRSRLYCSQQGDLSSAPLIAQEKH